MLKTADQPQPQAEGKFIKDLKPGDRVDTTHGKAEIDENRRQSDGLHSLDLSNLRGQKHTVANLPPDQWLHTYGNSRNG